MSYHLTRPPRLPLPIEEEVHTPGSPIIAPSDIDVPVLDVETLDDVLPRRSSALSNTTIDEEDAEELRVDKSGLTVPTTFEWVQGGEKVYVTGTIFQWNKKHRLHPEYVTFPTVSYDTFTDLLKPRKARCSDCSHSRPPWNPSCQIHRRWSNAMLDKPSNYR